MTSHNNDHTIGQKPVVRRRTDQLQTALCASLGHDLLTRVTVIQVAASNLRSLWLSRDDRVEQSELILDESRRLCCLVEDIVKIVRINGPATLPEPRWALPSEIIALARHQIERGLQQHTVEAVVSADAPIHVDPQLTAKALAHLLENAAQYAPSGSLIRIDARQTETGFEFTVADCGPGIAPEDLPHLFERCYRGMAGRSRTGGTGLGLWIARELVEAASGRLTAANRPTGGSVFTIVIADGADHAQARKSEDAVGSFD